MTPVSAFKADITHVFYGGTFDPPHVGHRLVVMQGLKALPDAKIVLIPSAQPAGAYGQHKSVATPFADRVAMLKLLFEEELSTGRVLLDTLESELPGPNYSYLTLEALEEKYPGSRWGILVGFDQLQNLSGWKEAQRLLARYGLIAIERPGTVSFEDIRATLEGAFGKIEERQAGHYTLASGRDLIVVRGEVSEAQSRLIRSSRVQGETKDWLAPKVIQYIREHGLYGESEDI